jgi:hypothetical protein
MNKWTKLSIEYANQSSYLDDLFQVYPTIPDGIREINGEIWGSVEKAFKKKNKSLGIEPMSIDKFVADKNDAILDGGDKILMDFASQELNYKHNKGLDFVARFNGKYVIGEAKFLTDFGGHQNAQFADAISTIETKNVKAEKIAILDGVLYIKGNNKMYKSITDNYAKYNIMSALVLRNYLYQL